MPGAEEVCDIVFFVGVVSVLVRGVSLPWVARRLGVAEPNTPLEQALAEGEARGARLVRVTVGPALDRRPLVDVRLPGGALVVVVERGGEQLVPQGGTMLRAGDVALVVMPEGQEPAVRGALAGAASA